MNQNPLFRPIEMGSQNFSNRIFMAPMTRSRSNNPEQAPTSIHAEYYAQRATAGLLITEGTIVSPRATGYINVPGIFSEKQTEAWKEVTAAVHKKGGRIFMQIWHVGRISHPDFHGGELPVAPSAINPEAEVYTTNGMTRTVTPQALSIPEIKDIVRDFRQAGENAMKAGFDGVEIHASNGYLFHQFFTNCSNQRTDAYGGSDENKARILFEVIEALTDVMPAEKIGVRLNPMLNGGFGITADSKTGKTFEYIVNRLNDYDLAYLHLSRPFQKQDESWFIADVIGHFRKIYRGTLVANGNYDPKSAAEEIASGRADAVAFGRPFIGNPDLVARIENGWELSPPDPKTFYTPGPEGYTDYPVYRESVSAS
jgi:N-ethylmaleimide reductase